MGETTVTPTPVEPQGKPTRKEKSKRRAVKEVRRIKVHGVWRWQARVKVGTLRRSVVCDSEEEALAAKARLRLELADEATTEQKAAEAPVTLALVCDAYLLDLEARGKGKDTLSTARNTVKRLTEFFRARMREPLAVTEADLYAFRAHRMRQWAKKGTEGKPLADVRGVKASTVNRDLRTVSAMLRHAGFTVPKGLLLKEGVTRVRWLDPQQEATVFLSLKAPFRQMAQLAALTLMRLTEIRTLRREYVHLEQGIIQLPHTKTGPGVVMLSAEAKRILEAQLRSHASGADCGRCGGTGRGKTRTARVCSRCGGTGKARTSEWVFPNPDTGAPYGRHTIGKAWRLKARKAGLADFHFHDLRHHGATVALNAGFSGAIVQELGRWKSERMMRRYAAVTDKTLRLAAEAVSGSIRPSSVLHETGSAQRGALR
jgi:integrase